MVDAIFADPRLAGIYDAFDGERSDLPAYLAIAKEFNLAISGGSDYHGEGTRRAEFFGRTALPSEAFAAFLERAGQPRDWVAGRV